MQGITVEQRPAFREYVVRERVPTYTIPERVIVGATLPDAGVTITTSRKPIHPRRIATQS